MKKVVALLLIFVILINVTCVNAFATEEKEIQVQIPCQYTVGFDINEGIVNGYLIGDDLYVTSSVIEMLTGYNAYYDDSFITFMKEERTSSFFYRLNLDDEKIIRYAALTQTEWDVNVKRISNGSYVMNLEEILLSMNVQFSISDDEEYLICTYLPYTVYDAWLAFTKSIPLLFSWAEIEADQGNTDPQKVGVLSAINSLYIDYNDHFVSDAFISWWADDVLTATEEQYMDAMAEILLCMSEDNNGFLSDDDLYETYKHDNKALGLTVKLLKLLDVDEEISNITKVLGTGSSLAGKGITVLDLVNTLIQYQSIQETQRDVLKELFVNFPMYAQAEDFASKHIYNAANHLSQRIDDSAVGTTTTICDTVIDLFVDALEGTITKVTPVLAIEKAVATIIKITPGLSDLADANKHINLGCDTWALLMLSIYNYNHWVETFYNYNFPSSEDMNQLKLVMLFRIMASMTARQHFIKADILQESTVATMNEKNKELTQLYFLIESSKSITAPVDNSPTISWNDYLDLIQVSFDDTPTANNDISLYMEAANKTTATGSWTEDLTMTANMTLTSGSATTKAAVTVASTMDIDGYSKNDSSNLRMSGSANMSIAGQHYAWDMTYANGVAHYDYTEPVVTSADLVIDPSYFDFGSITQDMVSASSSLGNTIEFTVRGDTMTERGLSAVALIDGAENLQYGDVYVTAEINADTGKISAISMSFHASMTYQGYDAEVDYVIEYRFLERNMQIDVEASAPDSPTAQYVIGICQFVQHDLLDAAVQGFKDALTDKLGDAVLFEHKIAAGDTALCSEITDGFVEEKVDLIMAASTHSLRAAASSTTNIPILGTAVTDYALALGIDNWTGTTGRNISGTSDYNLSQENSSYYELGYATGVMAYDVLINDVEIESLPVQYQGPNDTVYLEDLPFSEWDRYTGNEGDSFIEKVGTRNSATDINRTEYAHGVECWVARWNFKNETSWVWKEWVIDQSYRTMQGEITVSTDCYNKSNYITNVELIGDGKTLCSYTLTPETNYPIAFSVDVSQVETLRISVKDEGSFSGGTSFILGNVTLT